jgi:hypothetical protein
LIDWSACQISPFRSGRCPQEHRSGSFWVDRLKSVLLNSLLDDRGDVGADTPPAELFSCSSNI